MSINLIENTTSIKIYGLIITDREKISSPHIVNSVVSIQPYLYENSLATPKNNRKPAAGRAIDGIADYASE